MSQKLASQRLQAELSRLMFEWQDSWPHFTSFPRGFSPLFNPPLFLTPQQPSTFGLLLSFQSHFAVSYLDILTFSLHLTRSSCSFLSLLFRYLKSFHHKVLQSYINGLLRLRPTDGTKPLFHEQES